MNLKLTGALCVMFGVIFASLANANEPEAKPIEGFVAQAVEKAVKEKKTVMLVFSGLTWCGPCQNYEKNVLSTKIFKDYASKNLVLVNIDIPANKKKNINVKIDGKSYKSKGSKALKKEYIETREIYSFSGVPSTFFINEQGKIIYRFTGATSNPAEFIEKIDKKLKERTGIH